MSTFNNFRPTLNDLEGRSLMSATLTAPVEEIARVSPSEVVVTKNVDEPVQTREHVLLARQVGLATADAAGFVFVGDLTADPGETAKGIFVRKSGGSEETYRFELEDVIVSGARVEATAEYYRHFLGRSPEAAGGSHALYQDITIPANAGRGYDHHLGGGSIAAPSDPAAATDYLLELDGIKGESSDK